MVVVGKKRTANNINKDHCRRSSVSVGIIFLEACLISAKNDHTIRTEQYTRPSHLMTIRTVYKQ